MVICLPNGRWSSSDCLHSIWNRVTDFRYTHWRDANGEMKHPLGSCVALCTEQLLKETEQHFIANRR